MILSADAAEKKINQDKKEQKVLEKYLLIQVLWQILWKSTRHKKILFCFILSLLDKSVEFLSCLN